MKDILEIRNLGVDYVVGDKSLRALENVTFCLKKGEILGVVGESASGKSTLALSIFNLLPANCKKKGEIIFENRNLLFFMVLLVSVLFLF